MYPAHLLSRIGGGVLLALAAAGGHACAMNSLPHQEIACTVRSPELLAEGVGGAAGVCAEIVRSLAATSPNPKRVEVTILSASRAGARVVTANGEYLPEMNLGSSDRALARSSFRSLGNSLARQLRQRQSG